MTLKIPSMLDITRLNALLRNNPEAEKKQAGGYQLRQSVSDVGRALRIE